ncbi:hypothetical protein AYL99_05818 [Fonsecaea erecta]|uniref:feruloyl esterase n=1 Tax=Fonsecaea erecta TaxID=1367422 RepID=A0A178ZN64_9EURO|nr:hypothetical protein AYL99_05818 [Fonsecaea erecta]OAP60816.1 hypothetical protein AYL99_05818 [Fonsecaea erecta]
MTPATGGVSPPAPSESHRSIPYDIKDDTIRPPRRHALLHVPDSYKSGVPSPLIVALHGKGQPAKEFEYHTQLSNAVFNLHYIVVYPEGVDLQWTGDPEAPPRDEVDDIGFIDVLIDHVMRDYTVDATRVYVAGFSNGGGLAALLAGDWRASGRIAAFAMASAAIYQDEALKEPLFSTPHPSRLPVPMLEFHGDADPVVHYEGRTTPDGPTYDVYEWLQGWAKRNGCVDLEGQRVSLYDGRVEKIVWSMQGSGPYGDQYAHSVIEHYKIAGFGHGWPSRYPLNNDSQERHGPTYFDATPLVMEFFGRFKRFEA